MEENKGATPALNGFMEGESVMVMAMATATEEEKIEGIDIVKTYDSEQTHSEITDVKSESLPSYSLIEVQTSEFKTEQVTKFQKASIKSEESLPLADPVSIDQTPTIKDEDFLSPKPEQEQQDEQPFSIFSPSELEAKPLSIFSPTSESGNAVASSSRTPMSDMDFDDDDDSHSCSTSSSPNGKDRKSGKKNRNGETTRATQLISHLPRVEEDALTTFDVLSENTFEKKTLGRSNQQEDMMICDCVFNPSESPPPPFFSTQSPPFPVPLPFCVWRNSGAMDVGALDA